MRDFDHSWLNNDEYLMVLQIVRRMLKKVLNYHIYMQQSCNLHRWAQVR